MLLRKMVFFPVLLALFTILLSGCDDKKNSSNNSSNETKNIPADQLQTKFVTIATGGASGPYNIIGTTLAEIYSKDLHTNSKTQTTGASVENMNLLKQKKVDMAFTMSDILTSAINGTGNFPEKISNIRQIAALYPNYVQIVTSAHSGINTIMDLKGKRIALGAQNSGVEVNARNLLANFGITYNDIKPDYLGYAEAADALKAGKIDAAFLTSGLPNSALLELEHSFDLKLVSIPHSGALQLSKTLPYFIPAEIPAGTYGNSEPIPTVAIKNALVVRSGLSDDDVYKLTKTFFENLPKLQTAHQAAKAISLKSAQQGLVAPLHSGAKRYYDEMNQK